MNVIIIIIIYLFVYRDIWPPDCVLVGLIGEVHYFRVMRSPELSPAVFAHGLYCQWNLRPQKASENDEISVLTVDSSCEVASRAVAERNYDGHNLAVFNSTADGFDADFGDPVTSANDDHAPLNDDHNRAMPTDLAVGNDDVASDADVNPMSSGDDEFLSAQGKYHYLYNDK